jgi:hypothetical protein
VEFNERNSLDYLKKSLGQALGDDSAITSFGNLSGQFYHIEKCEVAGTLYLNTSRNTAVMAWGKRGNSIAVTQYWFGKLNNMAAISILLNQVLIVAFSNAGKCITIEGKGRGAQKRFVCILEQYGFTVTMTGKILRAELSLCTACSLDSMRYQRSRTARLLREIGGRPKDSEQVIVDLGSVYGEFFYVLYFERKNKLMICREEGFCTLAWNNIGGNNLVYACHFENVDQYNYALLLIRYLVVHALNRRWAAIRISVCASEVPAFFVGALKSYRFEIVEDGSWIEGNLSLR